MVQCVDVGVPCNACFLAVTSFDKTNSIELCVTVFDEELSRGQSEFINHECDSLSPCSGLDHQKEFGEPARFH